LNFWEHFAICEVSSAAREQKKNKKRKNQGFGEFIFYLAHFFVDKPLKIWYYL
jgi:hypothetical protein